MKNEENSENKQNLEAWQEEHTYEAWIERYGTPRAAVEKARKSPSTVLIPLLQFLGDVKGKRIINLMGSNGIKALSLAMLGADVTVVDYSPGNARYALELAREAGLVIKYIVADVLQIPADVYTPPYDIVFAELGIVHYFTDLKPFMDAVYNLLAAGGRFILRDFHPVSTKLLTYRGPTAKTRKYKVTGDYFDTSLEEKEVSYTKHLSPGHPLPAKRVVWRKWTLGEVVTAVAASGLFIRILQEEPNLSSDVFDKGIPKTYTLVAERFS
jgi:SAM-dependent methyltransferase